MIDCFAVNLGDPLQLDNIQPTFSKFTFRDEGVRLAETRGDLFLQITCIVPRFYQTFQECLVSSLVCRIAFVHKMRVRDCQFIPQNREWIMGAAQLVGKVMNLRMKGDDMKRCCLEFPETTGRTIEHIRYIYDPSGAPEVDIRFTDGISLSIKLQIDMKAEGELYRTCEGDVQVLHRYPVV